MLFASKYFVFIRRKKLFTPENEGGEEADTPSSVYGPDNLWWIESSFSETIPFTVNYLIGWWNACFFYKQRQAKIDKKSSKC